jgi:hypothetical protein
MTCQQSGCQHKTDDWEYSVVAVIARRGIGGLGSRKRVAAMATGVVSGRVRIAK